VDLFFSSDDAKSFSFALSGKKIFLLASIFSHILLVTILSKEFFVDLFSIFFSKMKLSYLAVFAALSCVAGTADAADNVRTWCRVFRTLALLLSQRSPTCRHPCWPI